MQQVVYVVSAIDNEGRTVYFGGYTRKIYNRVYWVRIWQGSILCHDEPSAIILKKRVELIQNRAVNIIKKTL